MSKLDLELKILPFIEELRSSPEELRRLTPQTIKFGFGTGEHDSSRSEGSICNLCIPQHTSNRHSPLAHT
eukprot:2209310-Amphidinium_carterae.2